MSATVTESACAQRPVRPAPSVRKLSTLTLIAATFFMVSGGPFGLEELVSNAGYARSVLVLVITPLLWSLPTALMVSELSGAIPRDGGYYVWVTRALGPFWGFQEAWLSLAASIFDMALYPTVFILYASHLFPALQNRGIATLVALGMVALCALWNLGGARTIGNSALVMGAVLLAPFLVMAAVVFSGKPAWHSGAATADGTLLTGVLVAMWNFMGWDNASTVAGEVENPQRTYSRALLTSAALVAVTYIVPVVACWRAGIDPSHWTTGSWAEVGAQIGGRGLEFGIIVAGMLFGIGLFNSLSMSYTRVPLAMAEDGWLPSPFRKLNRFGAPWVSIIACAVAWAFALSLGFVNLIELDVAIYGLSLLLEFAALIALRIREPHLARPFRVPGGLSGAFLLSLGPTLLIGLAVFDSFHQHVTLGGFTFNNLALSLAVVAIGPLQYWFAKRKALSNDTLPGATERDLLNS